MPDLAVRSTRALLGGFVAALLAVGVLAAPAAATVEDCGGGDVVLLQDDVAPATIVGARIVGIGADCDGQPVGVQFLGNDAGDPALPADELAHAYSDKDPCTGADQPDGVLRGGTVDVLLCEASATSGHVDGRQLTRMRLITTAGTTIVEPEPTDDPAPAGPGEPDPAPDPVPDPPGEGDLPMTGADVLRAVLLGAALVLAGSGLVRLARGARVGRSRIG